MIKIALKSAKHLHKICYPDASSFDRNWKIFPNKDYASKIIESSLLSDNPTMIARLGSTELTCMVNYIGVKNTDKYKSIKKYISNQTPPWWWEKSIVNQMQNWSGFFPAEIKEIEKFCQLMIEDLSEVDILGSWLKQESFFSEELFHSKKVMLEDLEPFFARSPWTKALENRKILVVHPFSKTILTQYQKREKLFEDNLLPNFDLQVIQAVQTIAGEKAEFTNWFEALDSMKHEISKRDFDICILGCGAYGFPLASFVKKMGKKSIHLGGVAQLLFGIKGRRWENYIVYPYTNLYNEHWVRPSEEETPKTSKTVEGACYW